MENTPVIVELDFDKAELMTRDELREKISAIEEILKNAPQVELPVKHHFSKGVYGREMPIPSGTLLVGKIHKHQTMNVISKGKLSVLSQDGIMHLQAPHTFVSTPGAKRVIYAHEDSVWTCFHGTEETEIEKIESEFIAKDYTEVVALDASKDQGGLCLGSQPQL